MEPLTPTLPLELVEQIVDLAGQGSTKACMLVSKQFHAGALRNIYRNQSLDLNARSDILEKKYDRLFRDEEDQFLLGGNRGRHVRKLSVDVGRTSMRFWNKKDPEYEEDILLRLLEAFSQRTGLRILHVHGGGREYEWDSLPLKVREGFRVLIQSPNLSSLSIQEFYSFPLDFLHGHKALRLVKLNNCDKVTNTSGHAVILPKATYLLSHYLGPVENGFMLPRLRALTGHHSIVEERQDSWIRIAHAREALRRVNLVDNQNAARKRTSHIMTPALPANLKLSDFPILWYMNYTYEGGSWTAAAPLLCNIIPFFEVTVPVPEFNVLSLHLSLDQSDGGLGERFWAERKDLVASDRSWATLDTVLATQLYPNLEEVCIGLKIFNRMLEVLDSEIIEDVYSHYTGEKEAFAQEVKYTVLGHFVKLRARGIDVAVELFHLVRQEQIAELEDRRLPGVPNSRLRQWEALPRQRLALNFFEGLMATRNFKGPVEFERL